MAARSADGGVADSHCAVRLTGRNPSTTFGGPPHRSGEVFQGAIIDSPSAMPKRPHDRDLPALHRRQMAPRLGRRDDPGDQSLMTRASTRMSPSPRSAMSRTRSAPRAAPTIRSGARPRRASGQTAQQARRPDRRRRHAHGPARDHRQRQGHPRDRQPDGLCRPPVPLLRGLGRQGDRRCRSARPEGHRRPRHSRAVRRGRLHHRVELADRDPVQHHAGGAGGGQLRDCQAERACLGNYAGNRETLRQGGLSRRGVPGGDRRGGDRPGAHRQSRRSTRSASPAAPALAARSPRRGRRTSSRSASNLAARAPTSCSTTAISSAR